MSNTPLLVAVGSLNPVKIGPVSLALAQVRINATVKGVAVPSGVAEQPIGADETTRGALARAHAACAALHADWGVGLEGGVDFDDAGRAWVMGVVAIVTASGRETIGRSAQMQLPPRIASQLREGAELGPLIDELIGLANTKQGLGAIGHLTNGLVPREDSWRATFSCALAPLLHPDLYW